MTTPTAAAHNVGYLTPTSARSQSLSSDDGSGAAAAPDAVQVVSSLATGLATVDITPRDERACVLDRQDEQLVVDFDIVETSGDKPTRLILVRTASIVLFQMHIVMVSPKRSAMSGRQPRQMTCVRLSRAWVTSRVFSRVS